MYRLSFVIHTFAGKASEGCEHGDRNVLKEARQPPVFRFSVGADGDGGET